ncbi:type II toxin-antitoxin system HicB family antitoxin [Streptomyces sp. NBC_00620]|uniref:type II toxin-antitoxin system HicB family antitoxin n=1 Tax=Streptomyces sp. NBC_00620 TaxID=2903666 RepID=UPI00224DC973|nr:type II toxin-antitoxin system HicB family antitoxin [Streptomyces sp. NBC_00620]MCX4976247.1 type II toxin-antitoxin system HicB family antitoxin [Streptomyces sp. NBC_00620]
MSAQDLQLEVVIYREDDGYVAQCLNVNVASDGTTEREALDNIREALELYFEDETEREVLPVHQAKLTKLTLQGA